MCFASLLVKRHLEFPKRPPKVWLLDTSKQAASSFCAHMSGIAIATLIEASTATANECAWYFITFTMDTSLGVTIAYIMVRAQDAIVNQHRSFVCLGKSGEYGNPPDYGKYSRQMILWCIITVLARICVGLVMFALQHPLSSLATIVATPFENHPQLFLVLVMIACPLGMNIVQLWVQDTFLKKKEPMEADRYFPVEFSSSETSEPPSPPDSAENLHLQYAAQAHSAI